MPTPAPPPVTPLDGLRILDLSRFIAGPLCCQILGDMGAEVIKVERPGGEDSRAYVPHYEGHSLYTFNYNRNKHGITLDTRHAGALDVLEDLVRCSDVVVENFRPGTLDAMGLGWDRIHEINPRAVLVSISGFGQTGPDRDRALFDAIAQAASGLMSLTGDPGGVPTMAGAWLADHIAAFHGVMGTMMALAARTRTGEGQHVDIACLDALFGCMGTLPSAWRMLGEEPHRHGNRDHITVPANVYPAADGWIYLHAGTDPLFPRLATAMGHPELASDPRFAVVEQRLANVDALDDVVRGWTRLHPVAGLSAALAAAGVPYSPVASIPQVTDSEQIRAREMMIEVDHPELGPLAQLGMALKLGGTPGSVRKAPPLPGEDNAEVYRDLLGITPDRLADMRADGLI